MILCCKENRHIPSHEQPATGFGAVVLIPQKSLAVDHVDQTLASYHQKQASAKQQHRNLWFGAMPRDYFEVTETGENDGEICHSRDQL